MGLGACPQTIAILNKKTTTFKKIIKKLLEGERFGKSFNRGQ